MKVKNIFGLLKEINLGVPQGLELGASLFNVFTNDIFLFVNDTKIFSYANDTTIYACHTNLSAIITNLEADGPVLGNWFSGNFVKPYDDEYQLMIFGNKVDDARVKIGNL